MPAESEDQSATVARLEPLRNYQFVVDFGFEDRVLFHEAFNIGARIRVIPFCPGGIGETVRYLTGRVEYSEATFRYGVTQSASVIWDWFREGMRGRVQRRDVSVVMLQPDGVTPEFSVNLMGAWITQLITPSLHASGSEAAIEEIRVMYEGFEIDATKA